MERKTFRNLALLTVMTVSAAGCNLAQVPDTNQAGVTNTPDGNTLALTQAAVDYQSTLNALAPSMTPSMTMIPYVTETVLTLPPLPTFVLTNNTEVANAGCGDGDELLGPPNDLVKDSILPYGINRADGFSLAEACWVARIINGTMEDSIPNTDNIRQRFANARALAINPDNGFNLPANLTIDTPIIEMKSVEEPVTFQESGASFVMTDTSYAEYVSQEHTVQIFETQPPVGFSFNQIATSDIDFHAYAYNGGTLRAGEKIYLIKIWDGSGAVGNPVILFMRSACGNWGIPNPVRNIPQPTRGYLPPLVDTPTPFGQVTTVPGETPFVTPPVFETEVVISPAPTNPHTFDTATPGIPVIEATATDVEVVIPPAPTAAPTNPDVFVPATSVPVAPTQPVVATNIP